MANSYRRILIIKTGYSEFLDRGISTTVSLGDVLICTSLLHLYKGDHVTWVTSSQAKGLLKSNPLIQKLIIFGSAALEELSEQTFDVLINLEKDIGISASLSRIRAKKCYGFYFSDKTHSIETRKRSTRYLLAGQENHRDINQNALEILYETVDKKWSGQGLVLGRKRNSKVKYDFGFNYAVGSKWPTKAWPDEHWKSLEKLLEPKYSVSWQKGHTHLQSYINWIDSCRIIVTSDSLGQAIGSALGKKVITLYGPTNFQRMQNVPGVQVVRSSLTCPHMPCYLPFCRNQRFCMDLISPEKVANLCQMAVR
ncbi:MAG: glycosyltransferase family 9 protein [Candidatus Omnitrophica bacterium]|nr:glycosyltransferase family 9 protein [Candidatus Omnitrophota bacterium]